MTLVNEVSKLFQIELLFLIQRKTWKIKKDTKTFSKEYLGMLYLLSLCKVITESSVQYRAKLHPSEFKAYNFKSLRLIDTKFWTSRHCLSRNVTFWKSLRQQIQKCLCALEEKKNSLYIRRVSSVLFSTLVHSIPCWLLLAEIKCMMNCQRADKPF